MLFFWVCGTHHRAEVAGVLSGAPGVLEANVYGVKVFDKDGRAGMACLVTDPAKFDPKALYAQYVADR